MPPGRTFAWPYPIRARPWDELAGVYDDLTEREPAFAVMAAVVESVQLSGVEDRLAATTSMHDLLVVDRPVPEPPLELIRVSAPGSLHAAPAGLVRIQHCSHTNRNDVVDRPAEEAVALFWRFVREKLGIVPLTGVG